MSELSTDRKGNIAEHAIALAATKLDIDVYRPVGEGGRYDLIFDLGSRLLRVQCKWAPRHEDCVLVRAQSCRRAREGLRSRGYTAEEVDAIAAYCPDADDCYLLPIGLVEGQRLFYLRLTQPRNAQRGAIRWANDFDFSTVDWAGLGAVAQPEERCRGTAEAGGSSPPSSITTDAPESVGAHQFRNHFGWYMQQAAAGRTFEVSRRGRPFARLGPPGSAAP